jgi:DNA primase
MDVIAYHRAGIKNVVATMGTNLSNDHINLLKSMPDIQTIVLSFDNDRAGKTATIANGIKLLEQNFRVFVVQQYSEKYKDVDELLQNEGAKSIENIIANQDDYILYLIKQAFSNDSMVLADKITKIQKILSIMVENDDILLKTLHFEALSKFSKLSISDIESQYRALLNKKYNEYGYKAAKKQIDEEIAISNQTPVSKLKSEIDECKYKMNIIGNVIANSLAQLISFSLHNSEIINLYEKQLQFSDMSKHFKLESKILKALLLVKKNNEQEIINFFQENDPKDADNIKYYLENLKLNTHFDLNSVNIDIAKKLVLNINIKKIEFANANLAIQMCIEEENGKDPVIINGLLEEIMQNNEKKKKIISIYY